MTTQDPPSEDALTLTQFRDLLRSGIARWTIGLKISDEDAIAVADDEALAASWFRWWRMSGFAVAEPQMPRPRWEEQEAAWQQGLPMRFHPPPGWPVPGRDWVMEYIGLPVTANRRPIGAPASDPVGWEWWIPQDPQWTTWMSEKRRRFRTIAFSLGIAFVACTAIAVYASEYVVSLIATMCAIVAGVGVLAASVQYVQFRRDPMSPIREQWAIDHGW
jgi:hypothetical protein